MGDVVYRSEVRIERRRPPVRDAFFTTGESARFGVHGAVAQHYGYPPDVEPQHAATIDYIVAAAGA
ncbi:MAG: hypothetical protein AB1416_04030 [Actinomycetota bacterium]